MIQRRGFDVYPYHDHVIHTISNEMFFLALLLYHIDMHLDATALSKIDATSVCEYQSNTATHTAGGRVKINVSGGGLLCGIAHRIVRWFPPQQLKPSDGPMP